MGTTMKSEPKTLSSIVIVRVEPEIDDGRCTVKCEVRGRLGVTADIFKRVHDMPTCFLPYCIGKEGVWREAPMPFVDNDRWARHFDLIHNNARDISDPIAVRVLKLQG